MKRLLVVVCVALAVVGLLASAALAGAKVEKKDNTSWYVTVDKVPTTFEECTALRDEMATTAQGGMVYYLVAQLVMIGNPELGEKCVIIGMDKDQLVESINLQPKYKRTNVKGWQLGKMETDKMMTTGFQPDKKYAAKSFVLGTELKAGYKLPELPYKYYVREHRVQKKGGKYDNTWRGFVNTSGNTGSGAVPFTVKKNAKGVWKAFETSSFYSGTADPPKADTDDL